MPRTSLSSFDDDPLLDDGSASASGMGEAEDSIFFVAPEAEARPQPPPAPAPDPRHDPRIHQDPVLAALVDAGVCAAVHLSDLWARAERLPAGTPLWRAAIGLPGVAPEAVFATAAQVAGHPTAVIEGRRSGLHVLVGTLESLPDAFRRRCLELNLLPFAYQRDPASGHLTLCLATEDVDHPEVQAFVRQLRMPARLAYAPQHATRRYLDALRQG